MDKLAPFIRIGLRIGGGFLVGKGYASEDTAAALINEEIIGAIVVAISEAWYWAARRYAWEK